jgi:hypothetical protein
MRDGSSVRRSHSPRLWLAAGGCRQGRTACARQPVSGPGPRPAGHLREIPRRQPFTKRFEEQFRARPQPSLTSREYTRNYSEVKKIGCLACNNPLLGGRTPDQTNLALLDILTTRRAPTTSPAPSRASSRSTSARTGRLSRSRQTARPPCKRRAHTRASPTRPTIWSTCVCTRAFTSALRTRPRGGRGLAWRTRLSITSCGPSTIAIITIMVIVKMTVTLAIGTKPSDPAFAVPGYSFL